MALTATTEQAMVAALAAGATHFVAGEFFAAHERWEDAWHIATGDERRWIQGLIQIAAGLHQRSRRRFAPGASLLRKGLAKCAAAPARLHGIDVTAVRAAAERALADGEAAPP